MKLTTTLNLIRANSPCTTGYRKLCDYLGGIKAYGEDTEINLLTILESNGVQDMLWCIRATHQDSKRITSQLAIEFAAEVLPIYESRYPNDCRVRDCIQGTRDFLGGKISKEQLTELRNAAAAAAYAADADADADAAAAAAYAADAAADADAYAAAYAYTADAAAAAAAAARQKMRDRQSEIIKSILEH